MKFKKLARAILYLLLGSFLVSSNVYANNFFEKNLQVGFGTSLGYSSVSVGKLDQDKLITLKIASPIYLKYGTNGFIDTGLNLGVFSEVYSYSNVKVSLGATASYSHLFHASKTVLYAVLKNGFRKNFDKLDVFLPEKLKGNIKNQSDKQGSYIIYEGIGDTLGVSLATKLLVGNPDDVAFDAQLSLGFKSIMFNNFKVTDPIYGLISTLPKDESSYSGVNIGVSAGATFKTNYELLAYYNYTLSTQSQYQMNFNSFGVAFNYLM